VHRLAHNGDVVRSKWAAGQAVRAGLALGGRIFESIRNRSDSHPAAGGPFSNATLRAAAGWLFFRVARSLRIDSDMRGAERLRPVFKGGARNRAYLAERIANMEIKGLVTLRLKPL
jgi:hypothetical protein